MYKLIFNSRLKEVASVLKKDGNIETIIPFAPDNTDYQAYLKWLELGNTPIPADTMENT